MVADTAVNMEADNVVDKVAGIVADMADDKKMSLPDMLLHMVADKEAGMVDDKVADMGTDNFFWTFW